jgi:hypothetical protein
MKRHTLAALTLTALAFALPAVAGARTYFGFEVGVGNAPPPPVIEYRYRPSVMLVPRSNVYVVEDTPYDYDQFRYGNYWYVVDDGYWYRSRSYRGPFRVVDVRYVPRPIFMVPAKHWKHPKVAYRDDRYDDRRYNRNGDRDNDRYYDRDKQDRGRGRGHGHGHD